MLDKHGYRPNVGIILLNQDNQVFWGKRIREQSWQFPQGGINAAESPQQAMYRELHEEIGLGPQHVSLLGRTRDWLHYDVWINLAFHEKDKPVQLRRSGWKGFGPVPYRHEPNRGFLRCVAALARAADTIGETDEYHRCLDLLDDCDPSARAEFGLS